MLHLQPLFAVLLTLFTSLLPPTLFVSTVRARDVNVLDVKRAPLVELPPGLGDGVDNFILGPDFFTSNVNNGPSDSAPSSSMSTNESGMDSGLEDNNSTSMVPGAFKMATTSLMTTNTGAKLVDPAWSESVKAWNQVCWSGRVGKTSSCPDKLGCKWEVFIRNYSKLSQVSPHEGHCGKGLLDNLRGLEHYSSTPTSTFSALTTNKTSPPMLPLMQRLECKCEVLNWECYAYDGPNGEHGIWAIFGFRYSPLATHAVASIPKAVRKATGGEAGMETKDLDCCAWGDYECFGDANFPGRIHQAYNDAWEKAMAKIVSCEYYDCAPPEGPPRLRMRAAAL
ncbi:hypothetical protein BD289DRAFT_482660 [Coniella lustricola]|uniref:Uncharacterized protein n=1 Tax=Coniella lustricola TaxID=2025994 RepID=A0A2T3A815_9PEZI|nr:hypothetical protein BD289DRAFT_482660 [Coniella lustricola]